MDPALADANDVFSELGSKCYMRLFRIKMVWNELLQNVDEVNVLSASESHNKSNINKSIKEALVVIEDITKQALFEGKGKRLCFYCIWMSL